MHLAIGHAPEQPIRFIFDLRDSRLDQHRLDALPPKGLGKFGEEALTVYQATLIAAIPLQLLRSVLDTAHVGCFLRPIVSCHLKATTSFVPGQLQLPLTGLKPRQIA